MGGIDINYNQVKRIGTISLIDKQKKVKEIDFVVEEYLGKKCVVKKNKNKEDEPNLMNS